METSPDEKVTKALKDIEQAFLQLEFSLKLLCYTELGKICKSEFDTVTLIGPVEDRIHFKHDTFSTYADLEFGAENGCLITAGACAIVLDRCLTDVGLHSNPSDKSPKGMLRKLVYMIRCAYAHDIMYPKWKVKGLYRQPVEVRLSREMFRLDLSKKDGNDFRMQDIGGYRNFFIIKDLVCDLVRSSSST